MKPVFLNQNHQAERSIAIDCFKALAAVFVVLHHSIGYYADCGGTLSSPLAWLLDFITSVHVRLFIIIAGFLCHSQSPCVFIKKKIFRILIPLWFFSTLKILYSLFLSDEFRHGTSIFQTLYEYYLVGGGYWFCYCIFFLYLLSIFLWRVNDRRVLLGVSILLIFVNQAMDLVGIRFPKIFQMSGVIAYAPYFSLGYALRFYKEDIFARFYNNKNEKNKTAAFIITAALCSFCALAVDILFAKTNLEKIYTLFLLRSLFRIGAMCSIVFCILPFRQERVTKLLRVVNALSAYSLQIMLLDSFFKVILYKIALRIFEPQVWLVFVLAAVNISLSVLTCAIVRRIPGLRRMFGL